MRINVGNIQCQAIIGGKDNLLPFNLNKTLRDFLKVRADGYQFSPAYKNKKWDGYRHFITEDGRFATGYLPAILKYMEDLDLRVELVDTRGSIPKMRTEFDPTVGDWEIRDYQKDLVVKALTNELVHFDQVLSFPRGIIDAATNAGKNSIMTGIVNNVENAKALMLIHNADIFDQACKFFGKIFDLGMISSKHYKIGQFTVAMQKTLMNRLSESTNVRNDIGSCNILLMDEGHRVGGADYARLISFINAPVRILVSGTPLDSDDKINKMIIVGVSGKVLGKVTNKFLIDEGHSLKPIIHILLNDTKKNLPDFYEYEYQEGVQESKARTNALKDFIADGRMDKFILVAFAELAHGEFMYEQFAMDPRFRNIQMNIVHGEDKERKTKIQDFAEGKTQILFTSTIMQEGLNIENIQVLVYAIGGKAKISVKQFIGRAVRDDGKSQFVEVVDFYDIGQWISEHSRKRIRLYKKEQFEINYHYKNDRWGRPILDKIPV